MRKLFKLTCVALIGLMLLGVQANAKTTIRIGTGGEPASLDPHKMSGTWENMIGGDIFMGLIQYAADGSSLPGMATDWKVSDDGLVYTFNLRKDAVWSDGKPLTSEDFVFAYKRIIDPKTAAKYANILYTIKNAQALNTGKMKDLNKLGVKAVDPHTLQITLEYPAPYFLAQLKHYTAYPLPKHVIEKFGKDWSKPENIVSNGAFKLVEWKSQSHIKAVKNDKFYDADKVKIDEIIYYPTEDRSSALKRFRAGEIDYNEDFPTEQYKWLKQNMADETRVSEYTGIYHYPINMRVKKFQDKRVREALALAINREILVDKVLTTGEVAAYGFSPNLPGYTHANMKFKDMSMKDRIAKAKKLLSEAGYSKDKPLEIDLSYNTSENHKKVAVAVAAMWKSVGVKTKLSNSEVAVHYANMEKGKFEIGRAGWVSDYPDAQNFLFLLEYPNTLNYGAWSNEKFNALMKKANTTADLKQRAKIMQEAEQLALDEFATIPIHYYISKSLVSKKLKGWVANPENVHRTRWLSK